MLRVSARLCAHRNSPDNYELNCRSEANYLSAANSEHFNYSNRTPGVGVENGILNAWASVINPLRQTRRCFAESAPGLGSQVIIRRIRRSVDLEP